MDKNEFTSLRQLILELRHWKHVDLHHHSFFRLLNATDVEQERWKIVISNQCGVLYLSLHFPMTEKEPVEGSLQ